MKNSMRKLKYTTLCIAGFWVLVLAFLAFAYTVPPFFATKTYCENLKSSTSKEHAEYIRYHIIGRAEKEGSTWKSRGDFVEMYDPIYAATSNPYAQVIAQSPQLYVGETMKMILSKEYDESQLFSIAALMKNLPIKPYLCFFDTIYEARDNNFINQEIVDNFVYIGAFSGRPIGYYFWHPSYTQRFLKHNPGKTDEDIQSIFNITGEGGITFFENMSIYDLLTIPFRGSQSHY
jgi:hypothetical protein